MKKNQRPPSCSGMSGAPLAASESAFTPLSSSPVSHSCNCSRFTCALSSFTEASFFTASPGSALATDGGVDSCGSSLTLMAASAFTAAVVAPTASTSTLGAGVPAASFFAAAGRLLARALSLALPLALRFGPTCPSAAGAAVLAVTSLDSTSFIMLWSMASSSFCWCASRDGAAGAVTPAAVVPEAPAANDCRRFPLGRSGEGSRAFPAAVEPLAVDAALPRNCNFSAASIFCRSRTAWGSSQISLPPSA
mmetsp:Transcript_79248/g.169790  ORF Transcript_79248/g.169790 Transcript_79248/m.169790 type:complete len:250 (-) Transcript_79248:249-998(-)